MTTLCIKAEQFFDGHQLHEHVLITINNGKVTAIDDATTTTKNADHIITDLIAPGLIDVQVNGGGGALFNANPTVETLKTIANAHATFGTTAMLPTLITDNVDIMAKAADAISLAIKDNVAGVAGVHFEGPHLSIPKKGVHSPEFIRPISDKEMAIFKRQDLGTVVVTLAPENVAVESIKELVDAGVRVCLGHSNADFETVNAALAAGASGFTHLFNAMSAFQSREPGMTGAALMDPNSWCGIIIDGHHVHYGAAKLAVNAKPKGKIMLVTDAMPPVGTDDDSFPFFGSKVIRTGDRLNALTGELAGSCLDMIGAVRNTVTHLDISLEESLRMAALYPAQYMQQADMGLLTVGSKADFIVINNEIEVMQTWISGKQVFNQ